MAPLKASHYDDDIGVGADVINRWHLPNDVNPEQIYIDFNRPPNSSFCYAAHIFWCGTAQERTTEANMNNTSDFSLFTRYIVTIIY